MGPSTASREASIPKDLASLAEIIEEVDKAAKVLVDRLGSVLMAESPQVAKNEEDLVRAGGCHLSEQIRGYRVRLEETTQLLRSVAQRVEL